MWYILTTMKLPNWTCILIIVILGSLVYANSLGGEFIWDDLSFIRDNAFLKDWSNVPHIFTETATTSMDVGGGSVRYNLYRPLQWLTFMADYSVWKLNPLGYHLTNIFLHISAALILFWFIALLFRSRMLSFLTALFFVIHPVHTEAVAYISGRADPLGLIFMLSSFGFYIKYTNDKKRSFFIFAVISFVLAILSRESSFILPLLLLLYHFIFKKKIRLNLFLTLAGITAGYTAFRMMMINVLLAGRTIPHGTFLERLPGAFAAIASYFRLLMIPFDLHMEYGNPVFSFTGPVVLTGMAIAVLSLVWAFLKRGDRLILFSFSWFYITLLPSLNLYPVGAYMAEHWLYLPSIGAFLLLVGLLKRLTKKRLKGPIVISLIIFYSFLTIHQNSYWKELIPFYERTLKYSPDSARLYTNLGVAYSDKGRHKEAMDAFKRAQKIEPKLLEIHYNMGTVYAATKRYSEAIDHFEKEIELNPGYFKAYGNLGAVYSDTGRHNKAIEMYKKALEIKSGRVEVLCNIGFSYFKTGRYDEAKSSYRKAIDTGPGFIKAYNDFGMVYHTTGEYKEAIALYNEALKIDPGYAEIYFNLGIAYEALNKRKEAIEEYKKAIKLDPGYASVHNNLAIAYFREGDTTSAIKHCDRAIGLKYKVNKQFLIDLEPYRK